MISISTSSFYEHAFLLDEESSTYGTGHSAVTASVGSPHKRWTSSTTSHACIDLTVSTLAQFIDMMEEEVAVVIIAREEEPEELEELEQTSPAGMVGEKEEPKELGEEEPPSPTGIARGEEEPEGSEEEPAYLASIARGEEELEGSEERKDPLLVQQEEKKILRKWRKKKRN